jgi:hypothetical protein
LFADVADDAAHGLVSDEWLVISDERGEGGSYEL